MARGVPKASAGRPRRGAVHARRKSESAKKRDKPKAPPKPEYSMDSLKKELVALAEAAGIELEFKDTKADIIAKLDAHYGVA